MTTRSAAQTNSEGSEDAFSSAWVPYSLPSGRRQKAAKKGLVCHFYCPARTAIDAISNALTAQQCGTGEQFGGLQSGCHMKAAHHCREACGNATHEPALLFRTKF